MEDDPEDHGAGELIAIVAPKNVYINGKLVICAVGDAAQPDNFPHFPPDTYPEESSQDVFVYGA